MDGCVFCKIIATEIPAHIIYRDENSVAFLTIEPVRAGHTLVVPREHTDHFQKMEATTFLSLMSGVHRVSKHIEEVLSPQRVGLAIEGWDVPHVHVHIIPMEDPTDLMSKAQLEGTLRHEKENDLIKMREQLSMSPL